MHDGVAQLMDQFPVARSSSPVVPARALGDHVTGEMRHKELGEHDDVRGARVGGVVGCELEGVRTSCCSPVNS